MSRYSGILMPMSSLPSKHGIGTMGKEAYAFVDFLEKSGQKYWQLLPLGPTSYGDSPYQSFSTFAGNPYYVDLDLLVEEGLLTEAEVSAPDWGSNPERTDYGKIYESRFAVLRKAFERGWASHQEEVQKFRQENSSWLENYALFMAVKAHFNMVSWTEWPDEGIRRHTWDAVRRYQEELKDDVNFYVFIQYLFFKQWNELRDYAHEREIEFIGDLPIYVALDSADVWSEPNFFYLDDENRPIMVAGVPPDAFNEDGQLWGNPLYDWDAMARDGYGWWIRRVDGASKLFDMIRIDHFLGFLAYYCIPAESKTARVGEWREGVGMKLLSVLISWFPKLKFIAEDLGFVSDQLKQLRENTGWPGMKILEFGFDVKGESDYMPHNCVPNSVCYIGTHDNQTVKGWLPDLNEETLEYARDYMHITEDEGWCWGMIRAGMSSPAGLFVAQMQDVLELEADARMNTPGTASGNWQWRMKPGSLTEELAEKLYHYTWTYRRLAVVPEPEEEDEEVMTVKLTAEIKAR